MLLLLAIDHPVWVALQQHLLKNFPEYITLFSALCIAGVCMMPKNRPKTIDDWYTWFRDTVQTAVPAARAQRESTHTVSETITPTTSTKQEATASTALDPPQVPPKGQ